MVDSHNRLKINHNYLRSANRNNFYFDEYYVDFNIAPIFDQY